MSSTRRGRSSAASATRSSTYQPTYLSWLSAEKLGRRLFLVDAFTALTNSALVPATPAQDCSLLHESIHGASRAPSRVHAEVARGEHRSAVEVANGAGVSPLASSPARASALFPSCSAASCAAIRTRMIARKRPIAFDTIRSCGHTVGSG